MCACMCMWRPKVNLGCCSLGANHPIPCDTFLIGPVSPRDPTVSTSPALGDKHSPPRVYHHTWPFYPSAGDPAQVNTLAWQVVT